MLSARSSLQAATFSRKTFLINCQRQNPFKISKQVQGIVWGTHKPIFYPHQDTGDNVVLINTKNIKLEGNLWEELYLEENTHKKQGEHKMYYKDVHMLDPTRIMKHYLSEVLGQPPPLDQYPATAELFNSQPRKSKLGGVKRPHYQDRLISTKQIMWKRILVYPEGFETLPVDVQNDIFDELPAPDRIYKTLADYSKEEIEQYPDIGAVKKDSQYF